MKIMSYVLSIAFFCVHSCFAIKVNGTDINTLIKTSDEVIHYIDPASNNVTLIIKNNGDIEIGTLAITNLKELDAYYETLNAQKNNLAQQKSKDTVHLRSGLTLTLNGFYGASDNRMIFDARETITIENAILESKDIFLAADKIKILNACFISADTLQIELMNARSLISIIKFKFNKEVNIAHPSLFCDIDFDNKESDKKIVATGAQEVYIVCKPAAFESYTTDTNA